MSDTSQNDNTVHFETDEVQATRGREQGLGVGARELQAQRDPERTFQPEADDMDDDDAVQASGADQEPDATESQDALREATAVQGEDEEA